MKKIILTALIAFSTQVHSEINTNSRQTYQYAGKSITIATEGAYPPFNFTNVDGSLGGFEVELGYALCDEIQAECNFVVQEWNGVIPALLAKKYDVLMAGMMITSERKQIVDFSIPYHVASHVFVGKKGVPFDKSNDSYHIGVQQNTVSEKKLRNHQLKYTNIHTTHTLNTSLEKLKSGEVDLVFANNYLAIAWITENKEYEKKGTPIYDRNEMIGIAFRPESPLKKDFDNALHKLFINGEYEKIYNKYF